MPKLTNKKLQEVKHNLYAVYTIGDDGRRCCSIIGCNIVRAMEEAQGRLCLIYSDELNYAQLPKEVFAGLGLGGRAHRETHPVWFWVLEVEAVQRQRATWQQIEEIFNLAKAWLKEREDSNE